MTICEYCIKPVGQKHAIFTAFTRNCMGSTLKLRDSDCLDIVKVSHDEFQLNE